MQFTISSLMNSVRKDSFNVDEFKKSCAFFEVLLQYPYICAEKATRDVL